MTVADDKAALATILVRSRCTWLVGCHIHMYMPGKSCRNLSSGGVSPPCPCPVHMYMVVGRLIAATCTPSPISVDA